MDCSTPGLHVHHQLPEFTQTHVPQVGDAIQPSNPVVPFSSCTQSLPASGSFQISQFFTSGGQSIGVSASTSVLPVNIQDWSPLGWTGWISLQSKGLSRVFPNTTVQKQGRNLKYPLTHFTLASGERAEDNAKGFHHLIKEHRASLVAQWSRIHLPLWETQAPSLVQEDPTCCRASKPVGLSF